MLWQFLNKFFFLNQTMRPYAYTMKQNQRVFPLIIHPLEHHPNHPTADSDRSFSQGPYYQSQSLVRVGGRRTLFLLANKREGEPFFAIPSAPQFQSAQFVLLAGELTVSSVSHLGQIDKPSIMSTRIASSVKSALLSRSQPQSKPLL